MQLMGVYDEGLVEQLAEVLLRLGVKRGMVVYGQDGLDELSMSAPTKVCEIRDGWFKTYTIHPEELGFTLCKKEDLEGGTPEENAQITRDILNGVKGPKRDAVVLNAAAALYLARDGMTLQDAVSEVEQIIDSGKAMEKLNQFIELTNEE